MKRRIREKSRSRMESKRLSEKGTGPLDFAT